MEIFSFLKRFSQRVKATSANGWTAGWTVITGGEDSERNQLGANKEWVYIATDRNAKSTASIRFKVMQYKNNGDDKEIYEGPLVEFLEQPAPNFTGKDFVYLNTAWKELTGNAFWERKGSKLIPLIPSNVTPVVSNGVITAYKYTEGSSQRVIHVDNVLHDRYIDPAKPYWGVGKLSKIGKWVDTSSYVTEFLRGFFVNGAKFGGFIETEEETEERIKIIKLGLANDHVGVANAHKWGVLPKGSKATPTSQSMADLEMGTTDDRYRDKILSAFGVPKSLVGLNTDVNRANAEAAEYIYAKYTIKPIADDLIEFLNNNIAAVIDPTGRQYFAYEEFVPINMEIALREREIALNRQPYKTVNEVRAEAGLPPIQGGDTIYGNPFQVPLGTPAPSVDPVDPNDTEDDTPDPKDEPKKAIPHRLRKVVVAERAMNSIVERIADSIAETKEGDATSHKKFVARVEAHEKILARKIQDFNNRQKRDVVQKLNRIVKDVSKGDLFDMVEEVGVLIDITTPILKGLMLEQAVAEYIAQGFDGEFNTAKPTVAKAIELAAKRMAKSYNNTTANQLKQALNDGINAGDDIPRLAERINTVYEFADTYRALAVARTESVYIANEGSREAYKQSGVVNTMRWYTAEDELTCEFCEPMNGEVIGIDEAFFAKGETVVGRDGGRLDTSYRRMDVPPLHPNCRCLIRPEDIDIS